MVGAQPSYTILIVDDKELDRDGICYLIRQHGLALEPLLAASGQQALALLQERQVHILLTDIKMPGMTGHELISEARILQPDLKIVIFSSHENFDYAHKAMDLGVTKYLLKPVKIDKFVSCMKGLIHTLDEEQRTKTSGLYYDVVTGRGWPQEAAGPAEDGVLLLLDFAEPYFNRNPLGLHKGSEPYPDLIEIPLNEYQCAFIAPNEEQARAYIARLQDVLDQEVGDRYILIYGGRFQGLGELRTRFEQMENISSAKFYLSESMVIDLDRRPEERAGIDISSLLKKSTEVSKLIRRKETQHAEELIEEIFAELQREVFVPTSFTKYISSEIVRGGLSESLPGYTDTLLKYIGEIDQTTNIDDLKSVCIRVVRQYSEQDEESMAIDQALEIIHREYMNNISLESVAADVYLSTCYLSYLFKKTTGMNFIKYLTAYRVDMAKKLLRTTKLKVGSICEMVGYSNVSYFCQIFKNHSGMTPAQFRASKL